MGTTDEKIGIFMENPGPVAAETWWLGLVTTHEARYQLGHRNKLLCMAGGVSVGKLKTY